MLTKRFIIFALTVLALLSIVMPAHAKDRPIQLSLLSPIQLFPESDAIAGLRLSLLYGRNASVSGLDWGLVTHTTSGVSKGLQVGFVALSEADFTGIQYNFVNVVKGNAEGLQWGFVNYSGYTNGLQLGFVNYAMRMKGVQIGLVNVIRQGGQFPVFPIVNWSF